MKYEVVVKQSADDNITEAFLYYESKQNGWFSVFRVLGKDFIDNKITT